MKSILTILIALIFAMFSPLRAEEPSRPEVSEADRLLLGELDASTPNYLPADGQVRSVTMNNPTSAKVKRLVASFPRIYAIRFERYSDVEGEWERIIDTIATLKELKELTPFVRIDDEKAKPLSQLRNLEALLLSTESLSAQGAASLRKLESVNRLTLYPRGEQADLLGQRVLRCFPQLLHLTVDGAGVSTNTFQAIGELKELKHLRGYALSNVSPSDFRFVGQLTELEELYFPSIKEKGYLQRLASLKKLKRLDITYRLNDDGEFEHLEGLVNLKYVRIGGGTFHAGRINKIGISDKALFHLRKMTKLQTLLLTSRRITGSGLQHLKDLDELQKLRLSYAELTPKYVPHLLELERLEHLDLAASTLEDDNQWRSLKQLKPLKHLKKIWIELKPEQWKELETALPGVNVDYYE